MKEKMVIGIIAGIGGISIAGGIVTTYNHYILPVIRHSEVIDKMYGFDKRLEKLEKIENRKIDK